MRKNTLNYTCSFLILYTIYDYFEHILRPESIYEKKPIDWLFFTLGAVVTFIAITYSVKYLIEKALKMKSLLIELVSFGIWLFLYLKILGSLVNKLFWPHNQLHFSFSFGPFFILLTIFFVFRILINLITKKKLFYST